MVETIRERLDRESDTLVVFPFWLSVMFRPLWGSHVPIYVMKKHTLFGTKKPQNKYTRKIYLGNHIYFSHPKTNAVLSSFLCYWCMEASLTTTVMNLSFSWPIKEEEIVGLSHSSSQGQRKWVSPLHKNSNGTITRSRRTFGCQQDNLRTFCVSLGKEEKKQYQLNSIWQFAWCKLQIYYSLYLSVVGLAFHDSSINDVILSPIRPQGITSEVIWDQRWSRTSFGVSAGHNNVDEERLEKRKYQTQTLLLSSLCSPSRSLNTELPVRTTPPAPLLLEPSPTPDTPPLSITPRDHKHSNAPLSRPGHARSSSDSPVRAQCDRLYNCKSTL